MRTKRKFTAFLSTLIVFVMLIPNIAVSAFEYTPTAGTDKNGKHCKYKRIYAQLI